MRLVRILGITALLGGSVASIGLNGVASATPTPSCASGTCTVTYTTPSTSGNNAQSFTVPTGVSSLDVTLYGASGASCGVDCGAGGTGAEVTATLAVASGTKLEVDVGGVGGTTGTGGVNGGGAGGRVTTTGESGGGGGGASDLSTGAALLVVAGGGGGAGLAGSSLDCLPNNPSGGNGGNADTSGSAGGATSDTHVTLNGGGGGGVGTTSVGGAGGPAGTTSNVSQDCASDGGTSYNGSTGGNGTLASGATVGLGGSGSAFGGGGGGGYASGGGGGFGATDDIQGSPPFLYFFDLAGSGGGGGGLSWGSGPGVTNFHIVTDAPTNNPNPTAGDGDVTITYANPANTDTDLSIATPLDITTQATGTTTAVTYSLPTVTDETNDAPMPSCSPSPGSLFAVGTTTVNCSVTDTDETNGPRTTSFTVTVTSPTTASLLQQLASAVSGLPPGMSLPSKVTVAQGYLASGDVTDTCGVLEAFVHEVAAQAGKKLTTAQALDLTTQAQDIESALSCSSLHPQASGPGFTGAASATASAGSRLGVDITTSGSPTPRLHHHGRLPRGVHFRNAHDGTALLSGTPKSTRHRSAQGTYPLTITATYGRGRHKHVVTESFTLTVTP